MPRAASPRTPTPAWVFALALAAVTIGLGVMQHRWVGQVSDAELTQLREQVRRPAEDVARRIDHELARAFLTFYAAKEDTPGDAIAAAWERYRRQAPLPDLIAEVAFSPWTEGGLGALQRFDPSGRTLTPTDWPPLVERMRKWIDASARGLGPVLRSTDLVSGRPTTIAVPRYEGADPGVPPRAPSGFVFVTFDKQRLIDELVPRAIAERFGALAEDYAISVVSPEERPEAAAARPDLTVQFFALRLDRADPALIAATGAKPPTHVLFDPRGLEGRRPGWALVVNRRGGSLEQVVARLRRRNLTVASAALLLLAGSATMLFVVAGRARRLAEQQRTLVAGFSHELRTPIAILRSAGDNLRDGIVRDAAQIERYGRSITQQAMRLSDLVERVLETATDDALGAAADQPIDPLEVVEAALATHAPELERRGVAVDRRLTPAPRPLRGDREALRRAFENLIDNALKHAPGGRQLTVSAAPAGGDPARFEIAVADEGPGLEDAERRHLFEPFFRGHAARAAQARGVGLGLHLVRRTARAHGGDVIAESPPGGGARFRIVLPIPEARA